MITLHFVSADDPMSLLIAYYSHGWPTHVDVVWEPAAPGLPPRLLGARLNGGVLARSMNYGSFTRTQIVTFKTTPLQDTLFRNFLQAQLGKPYDTTAVLAFIMDRDWRGPNSWFCSELVAAALEVCNFFPRLEAPTNRITPSDLLLLCSAFL